MLIQGGRRLAGSSIANTGGEKTCWQFYVNTRIKRMGKKTFRAVLLLTEGGKTLTNSSIVNTMNKKTC